MPLLKYLDLPPLLFPELDSTRVQEIFHAEVLIQVCILFEFHSYSLTLEPNRLHDASSSERGRPDAHWQEKDNQSLAPEYLPIAWHDSGKSLRLRQALSLLQPYL
jgi:hypothetical protein